MDGARSHRQAPCYNKTSADRRQRLATGGTCLGRTARPEHQSVAHDGLVEASELKVAARCSDGHGRSEVTIVVVAVKNDVGLVPRALYHGKL